MEVYEVPGLWFEHRIDLVFKNSDDTLTYRIKSHKSSNIVDLIGFDLKGFIDLNEDKFIKTIENVDLGLLEPKKIGYEVEFYNPRTKKILTLNFTRVFNLDEISEGDLCLCKGVYSNINNLPKLVSIDKIREDGYITISGFNRHEPEIFLL